VWAPFSIANAASTASLTSGPEILYSSNKLFQNLCMARPWLNQDDVWKYQQFSYGSKDLLWRHWAGPRA